MQANFLELWSKHMLWPPSYSSAMNKYLFIVSEIQLIAILLLGQFKFLTYDDGFSLSSYARQVCDLITLDGYLHSEEETIARLALFKWVQFGLWFTAVNCCMLIGFFLFLPYVPERILIVCRVLFAYLSQSHISFVFYYLSVLSFSTLTHMRSDQELAFGVSRNGWLIIFPNTALIIFNYASAIFASATSYNPMKTNNKFSSHTTSSQVMGFMCKAALTPLLFFSEEKVYFKWLFSMISVSLIFSRAYVVRKTFPYYHYDAMWFLQILSSISCSITLVGILFALSNEIPASTLTFAHILTMPLFVKEGLIFLQSNAKTYLFLENKNLTTESEVYKKLFAVSYIANASISKLGGDTASVCNISTVYLNALCSRFEHLYDRSLQKLSRVLETTGTSRNFFQARNVVYDFANRLSNATLLEAINKISDNAHLRLSLSIQALEGENKLAKALYILHSIEKKKMGFYDRVMGYNLAKIIQDMLSIHFTERVDNILNVKELIDYEKVSTQLVEQLTRSSEDFIKFWRFHEESDFNIVKLLKTSIAIEKEADEISSSWRNIEHNYQNFIHHVYPFYTTYLSLIRACPMTADTIREKYNLIFVSFHERQKYTENIFQDTLRSKDIVTIYVSLSKRSTGDIREVSRTVKEYLGWSREDLIGRNVTAVMPPFLREPHKLLLQDYQTKDQSTVFNKGTRGFVMTGQEHVKPCFIYKTLLPYIMDQLYYLVVLRPTDDNKDYMILVQDGTIDCFTKNLRDKMILDRKMKLNINDICMNSKQIFSKLNEDAQESNAEVFDDSINLQFKIRKGYLKYKVKVESLRSMGVPLILITFLKELESTQSLFTMKALQRGDSESLIPDEKEDELQRLLNFTKTPSSPIKNSMVIFGNSSSWPNKNNETKIVGIGSSALSNSTHNIKELLADGEYRRFAKKKEENEYRISTAVSFASTNTVSKITLKFEQAIHAIPREISFNILNLFAFLFLILCSSLMFTFYLQEKTYMSKLRGNLEVLSSSYLRAFDLVRLNILTLDSALFQEGLMDPTRHDPYFFRPGVMPFHLRKMLAWLGRDIKEDNDIILTALHKLDESLQPMMFEDEIEVFERTEGASQGIANAFSLTTQLYLTGNELATEPFPLLKLKNPKVKFILENSLDELYIGYNKVNKILVEDNKKKTENSLDRLLNYMIVIIVAAFMLIILVIYEQKKFIRKRNFFIEIFGLIERNEIEDKLDAPLKFIQILRQANNASDLSSIEVKKTQLKMFANMRKATQSFKKRSANIRGVNMRLFKNVMLVFLLIFALIFAFLFLYLYCNDSKLSFLNKMADLIAMYELRNNMNYLYAGLLFYVMLGEDTTISSKPVKQELDYLYNSLEGMQESLLRMQKRCSEANEQRFYDMLMGNLCDIEVDDSHRLTRSKCMRIGRGISQQGLIGIVNHLIQSYQSVRDFYDRTEQTREDKIAAFDMQDIQETEIILFLLIVPTFTHIRIILEDEVDILLKDYENSVFTMILVFLLLYSIIGVGLWMFALNNLRRERCDWRKVARKIPFPVIYSNRLMKNWIARNCGRMLDSVVL